MRTTTHHIAKLHAYLQDTVTGLSITSPAGRKHCYIVQPAGPLGDQPRTVWEVYTTRNGAPLAFIGTVIDFTHCGQTAYRELGLHWSPAPQPSYNTRHYQYWAVFALWLADDPRVTSQTLSFCRRCGRLLTTPQAIARGYGDECYKMVTHQTTVTATEPCDTCYYRHCADDEELLCYNCPVGQTFLDGSLTCDCCRRHREMEQSGIYRCDMYRPRKGGHDAK